MLEHASPKINQFYACSRLIFEENVLGLDVGMDYVVLFQKDESIEDLDCEGSDMGHLDGLELV